MAESGAARPSVPDNETLAKLKARYEAEGFTFVPEPAPERLPEFFENHRPDAVATKGDRNIAFEIIEQGSGDPYRFSGLRQRLQNRSDWQLNTVVAARRPSGPAIPRTSATTIRDRHREVVALAEAGHQGAAFVLAWALLEAALNADGDKPDNRPMAPAAVLETLATRGYIEPATERRIHPLVTLRDRVVHGDLVASVTMDDIHAMLGAIDEALMVEAP